MMKKVIQVDYILWYILKKVEERRTKWNMNIGIRIRLFCHCLYSCNLGIRGGGREWVVYIACINL